MTIVRRRMLPSLVVGALLVTPVAVGVGAAPAAAQAPAALQEALGCDPLDPSLCLLPFPNDAFTVADPTTATGRRIDFAVTAMPRNGVDDPTGALGGLGKPVDPTEWNRNDGFSPGTPAIVNVPGLDLHQTWRTGDRPFSGLAVNQPGWFDHRDHLTDIAMFERPDAPIVIIDAATGQRHPFWSELDQHSGARDGRRALILRPAVNFREGGRYVVALRDLRDASGAVIPAGAEFAAYRGGTATGPRADHFEEVFATLAAAGIARDDLHLAWDFTIASRRNLSERMLHIRDDAFGRILGDADLADRRVAGIAPAFTVTSTSDVVDAWTDARGTAHTQDYRVVQGRITVPNYLDRPQGTGAGDPPVPGSRFHYPAGSDLPAQNPDLPEVEVPFTCHVPVGDEPSFGALYGHGLLGSRSQIGDFKWPRRYGFAGCGLDWWGMSTLDLPTVATILADLSNFPSLPDRAQQGFLNFLFVGRAMVHPDGFVADAAFQGPNGEPLLVVDRGQGTQLFYDGNSQGGIMGGSLVAVSPDIHRGILGVPAMNYSTLLNRSVDWEGAYGEAYYVTYQDPLERQLGFALIQMLWDRGEANGYAHHMTTDPLPNTPTHEVMLQVAFSDHQVTNHAAEVQARTIGAPIMVPGLPAGRHWERTPYFTPTATYPHRGSALVYWDSGNATPPNGNVPADHAGDPHSHPRNEPAAGWQEAHFLLTGEMADVCAGGPYLTLRHPDNGGTPSCVEPDLVPGGKRRGPPEGHPGKGKGPKPRSTGVARSGAAVSAEGTSATGASSTVAGFGPSFRVLAGVGSPLGLGVGALMPPTVSAGGVAGFAAALAVTAAQSGLE
jgi:hypothetical protein